MKPLLLPILFALLGGVLATRSLAQVSASIAFDAADPFDATASFDDTASISDTASIHDPISVDDREASGVQGLRLLDLDGRLHRLGLEARPRGLVLVFLEPTCPIARRYVPELGEIAREATEKQIDFYGVLSDPGLSIETAQEFRREYELDFPLLIDSSGDLADRLRPGHVPEAFVIDVRDQLVYRGRIDDRFAAIGKLRNQIRHHDLRDAMEGLSRGESQELVVTEAVGCEFEAWDAREDAFLSYHRDVAPILAAHCLDCHFEGGIGPFAFNNYEEARRRAKMIAYVARERLMPPWRAVAGHGSFRDERILSERQIDVLEAWAKAGAPQGDPADAQPLPDPPEQGWRLGEPDLVLTMPQAFEVPATGEDIYRYFVIPKPEGLKADQVLTAIDFRPGDPTVVHHCDYFVDYSGKALAKEKEAGEVGFSVVGTGGFLDYFDSGFLGAWAPGVDPYELPENTGMYLKGGGDIVLEIHYHLSGKKAFDRSSIGLYFAKEPVQQYASGLFLGTQDLSIPAGESDYWRTIWMDVPAEIRLIGIGPHMHYLGREAHVDVHLPDGTTEPLIRIDDWDLRWQNAYSYREPVVIPKGSRIEARFRFDNSAENPANPHHPPQNVRWGWQTTEEMCELYMTTIAGSWSDESKLYEAQMATWYRSADPDSVPPPSKPKE